MNCSLVAPSTNGGKRWHNQMLQASVQIISRLKLVRMLLWMYLSHHCCWQSCLFMSRIRWVFWHSLILAINWNEFCVSQVYTFLPLMSSYQERFEFEEVLWPSAGDDLIWWRDSLDVHKSSTPFHQLVISLDHIWYYHFLWYSCGISCVFFWNLTK
jgi:hypothetical protein